MPTCGGATSEPTRGSRVCAATRTPAAAGCGEHCDLIPEEWGYPGAKIRKAIEEFNRRAAGAGGVLPSRLLDRRPLDEPPFYVVDAAPAITFTFGGLRIDPVARVLGE